MATKKEILSSEKELQKKKRTYQLTDEAFEKYKQFLSNPNQKKFCFKGYYYIERLLYTILHHICCKTYTCYLISHSSFLILSHSIESYSPLFRTRRLSKRGL